MLQNLQEAEMKLFKLSERILKLIKHNIELAKQQLEAEVNFKEHKDYQGCGESLMHHKKNVEVNTVFASG